MRRFPFALALWCGVALLLAVVDAARHRPPQGPNPYPSSWRLGSPRIEPLREVLERVDRLLPEGATVVVQSDVVEGGEQVLLLAWCRYLLPRQHVQLVGVEVARPHYRLVLPASRTGVSRPEQTVLLHEAPATLIRVGPRRPDPGVDP